jgi:hypothetical protein
MVIASTSPRCAVTNQGRTDLCVFAAEKCSETSDRCIFCIHARACPASIASALGIHGNKRSEAIFFAWDQSLGDCRVASLLAMTYKT